MKQENLSTKHLIFDEVPLNIQRDVIQAIVKSHPSKTAAAKSKKKPKTNKKR